MQRKSACEVMPIISRMESSGVLKINAIDYGGSYARLTALETVSLSAICGAQRESKSSNNRIMERKQ